MLANIDLRQIVNKFLVVTCVKKWEFVYTFTENSEKDVNYA